MLFLVCSMPWSSCPWFSAYLGSWFLGILTAAGSTQILRGRRRHPLSPKLVLTIRIMFLTTKTDVIKILLRSSQYTNTSLFYVKAFAFILNSHSGVATGKPAQTLKRNTWLHIIKTLNSLLFEDSLISCKQIKDNSRVLNDPNCELSTNDWFLQQGRDCGEWLIAWQRLWSL